MKRLENGTHFATIEVVGSNVVVTTGPFGSAGERTVTPVDRIVTAGRRFRKIIASYAEQGFRLVIAPMSPQPRDALLEAALRVDRSDPAPYQVYADWLITKGSPIGELITFEQRSSMEEADVLRSTLGLPDEDLATLEWKWGLWRSLRLNNGIDHNDDNWDGAALARPLFASTLCGALEELRIGVQHWDRNQLQIPALLAEAAEHAWAEDLRSLHLGDTDPDIDMAHQVIGVVGATITRAFPKLVELRLKSGAQSWRGEGETFSFEGLALPHLTSLVIETCSMSQARLQHALDAALPNLTTLELWFGSANQDADATVEDLAPLLSGARHAGVTHLGLRNAELTDAIAALLPTSPIAARLETLDLSMGTLGDGGAADLAKHRARFAKLRRLIVDDNYLTPAGLDQLRAAFTGTEVVSDGQKTPYEGEDERYATVGE